MPYKTPPKAPRYARAQKQSNKKVYIIMIVVSLLTVLLSGAAGYVGSRFGQTSSPAAGHVYTQSGGSSTNSSTDGVRVMDASGIVATLRPMVVEITAESVQDGGFFGSYTAQSAGSGVILSADGYIVTNNHVVADSSNLYVKTFDGKEYPATLCGTDPQTDIAVIKIDAEDLTPAVIGNSDEIRVGEAAIAIGNPLGSLGGTVTTGIISAVGREITIEGETMTLLQTDAAINPGNSGGGLFNLNGELIGVVNAKQSETGIEGLGFAIPISDVTNVIDDLVKNGKVTSRPMLNASLQEVSEDIFGQSNMEPGVYVVQVVPGGTADEAGLRYGDRIISFDGKDVTSSAEVKSVLKQHAIGDEVEMVISRDGKEETLTLHLQGSSN